VREERQKILLDKNIPQALSIWLREKLAAGQSSMSTSLDFKEKVMISSTCGHRKTERSSLHMMRILPTLGFIRWESTMVLFDFAYGLQLLKKPKRQCSDLWTLTPRMLGATALLLSIIKKSG